MKAGELRELSIQELMEQEKGLARELFNLHFQMATGQLSNHTAIKKTKKDIARLKTILKEMEATKGKTGA